MQEYLKDSLQTGHVICVLEGNAEESIIEKLLDNDKLIFRRNDTSEDGKLIRNFTQIRKSKNFTEKYLTRDYGESHVNILRIIDSKSEKFNLPRIYHERIADKNIRIFDILTRPEIEILVIINEGKYNEFTNRRGGEKASSYCKGELKLKDIKNKKGISNYYRNIDELVNSIKEYNRLHSHNDEYCLCDLLR